MGVDELAVALRGYISASQLGNRLGVSTEWARRLAQAGAVQAIRTPNGWLIEPTSASRLVAERAAARAGQGASSGASSV